MSNILKVKFGKETQVVSSPLYQYDYGQKVKIFGLDLPAHYEVHFSNYECGDATTVLASLNEFNIPDMYLQSGRDVYVWIYLHAGNDDGETEYQIIIPVIKRAKPTNEAPTPEEQSVITETIAALNDAVTESREGVERVQIIENNVNNVYSLVEADKDIIYQYKEDAKSYAEDAADEADRAEQAATHAEPVETSVFAARDEAVTASNNAAESENFARSYAEQTARDKSVAENAADNAAQSAQEAARSAASIEGDVEESEVAARQAEAAKNASEAAKVSAEAAKDGAEAAATNAGNSAGAAAQFAQDAETAKTAAAGSASDAVTSAGSASTSAQQAASSASTASAAASTATTKANDAATAASAAGDSATSASAASSAAISAKDDAIAAKTAAQAAATSATNSASSASSSATTASSAATTATAAQTAAEAACDRAETAAESVEESAAQIAQNTADIAQQKSAIEDLEALTNRKAGMLVDTASGAIASFVPDATIDHLLGLDVAVEPVQDLHGYDSPWPAGGGKNIANPQNSTNPNRSTYSYSTENDYLVEGTKTGNGGTFFAKFTAPVVSGENYIFSFGSWEIDGISSACQVYLYEDELWGTNITSFTIGSADRRGTWTATITGTIVVGIYTASSATDKTLSLSGFMIRHGSVTDATFAPYSNICPISGWDSVDIMHSGTDTSNPTTYTIQIGQTVYGGTLDVTAGKMVINRKIITLDGSENVSASQSNRFYITISDAKTIDSTNQNTDVSVICDKGRPTTWGGLGVNSIVGTDFCCAPVYGKGIAFRWDSITTAADWKTYFTNNPTQFSYELATPIEITLDPVTIATIANQTNNVLADAGDVTVEFAADLKHYIDSKIAAAVAALS